jgi:hypothetical protein
MTKIEEIKQKIKDLLVEVEQLNQPTTFEVGKVYKNIFSETIAFFSKLGICNYGFYRTVEYWANDIEMSDINIWQPATTKEWEAALIEYAKKQGFKAGVTVERSEEFLLHCEIDKEDLHYFIGLIKITSDRFVYYSDEDSLVLDGNYIYFAGQWATVVKEEPLIIGGVEVEIKDNSVKIGKVSYDKFAIKSLLEISRDFNEPITTELLTKIISKLK